MTLYKVQQDINKGVKNISYVCQLKTVFIIYCFFFWSLQHTASQWRRFGVFIANSKQISQNVMVFPLFTLNM